MSSRHLPSTQSEQNNRSHPPHGAPEHAMAATQVPPVGVHILPPPSMLARTDPWRPPHPPQPLFTPDPALTRPRLQSQQVHNYPPDPSPHSYYQPPSLQPYRPIQQAAAPLEHLLHPVSYSPAGSESSYTPAYRQQDPRRYQEQQLSSTQYPHANESTFQRSSAREAFETSRQFPLSDDPRLNPRTLPSPSQPFHRSSVGSQQSSTTSSSGYSAAPAPPMAAGSAAQSPSKPYDM